MTGCFNVLLTIMNNIKAGHAGWFIAVRCGSVMHGAVAKRNWCGRGIGAALRNIERSATVGNSKENASL